MASQTFSNPYNGRHAAAPSFGVIQRFNPSQGEINPHDLTSPDSPLGTTIGGTSHILNSASRSARKAQSPSFNPTGMDAGSPIVGSDQIGKGTDKQPSQASKASNPQSGGPENPPRPPIDKPGAELEDYKPVYPGPKTGPYEASASFPNVYAPHYDPSGAPTVNHPLFGGLARKALGDGALSGNVMPKGWVPPIGEI